MKILILWVCTSCDETSQVKLLRPSSRCSSRPQDGLCSLDQSHVGGLTALYRVCTSSPSSVHQRLPVFSKTDSDVDSFSDDDYVCIRFESTAGGQSEESIHDDPGMTNIRAREQGRETPEVESAVSFSGQFPPGEPNLKLSCSSQRHQ